MLKRAKQGLRLCLHGARSHAQRPANVLIAGVDLVFGDFHQLQPGLVYGLERRLAGGGLVEHAQDLHMLLNVDVRHGIIGDGGDDRLGAGRRIRERAKAHRGDEGDSKSSGAQGKAELGHECSFVSGASRLPPFYQWPLRPPRPSCTLISPRLD